MSVITLDHDITILVFHMTLWSSYQLCLCDVGHAPTLGAPALCLIPDVCVHSIDSVPHCTPAQRLLQKGERWLLECQQELRTCRL